MPSLEVDICDRLTSISAADWGRLFPTLADTYGSLQAVEQSGMEGFAFGSIVVSEDDAPLVVVPLFRTKLKLETLADGRIRSTLAWLARVPGMARLLHVGVLGIGFVEGEWSEIGYDRSAGSAKIGHAMTLAQAALRNAAAHWRLPLEIGLNFTTDALAFAGAEWTQAYARIDTYPCAYLPVTGRSVDAYIGGLSKNARKDIRKKLRECGPVRIESVNEIEPHLDAIYALYVDTVDRAELALGRQSQAFFRHITQHEPAAHYVLYWLGDELIAFNLLVRHRDRLIDKYFCMKPDAGRANSLYFVSWIENVRYCIEQAIPVYHAGPGAEMVKRRLGAQFIPSITLFRHRNPIVQMVLKSLRSLFAYKSDNCRTDNHATAPEAPAAMGLAS